MVLPLIPLAIGASAILGIGASIFSGAKQANAAKKAKNAQVSGYNQAHGLQEDQFGRATEAYAPYQQAGQNALGTYQSSLGLAGPEAAQSAFGAFQSNPGYQFAREQGITAAMRAGAASGGTNSGAVMKALGRFGSGLASQAFGDWQNRVSGLADMGYGATNNAVNAGQTYANNASNAVMGAANARASGYKGVADAWSNAATGVAQAGNMGMQNGLQYQQNQQVGQMFGNYSNASGGNYNGSYLAPKYSSAASWGF